MRRLFLDTEFTSLSRHRRLISLALVDPSGPECYVELGEGWALEDCSEFVVQIVMPQLDLPARGMSREQARTALLRFLDGYAEAEIISDALAWDWPLLLDLLAPAPLPSGMVSREIRGLLTGLEESQIPHHALLDARLMAAQFALRACPSVNRTLQTKRHQVVAFAR